MTPAAFTLLILDRQRPAFDACVEGWFGPDHAQTAKAAPGRYLLICTFDDAGADPRYTHFVEGVDDFDELAARFSRQIDVATITHSGPLGIDIRYFLNPDERSHINHILDERDDAWLAHVVTGGSA